MVKGQRPYDRTVSGDLAAILDLLMTRGTVAHHMEPEITDLPQPTTWLYTYVLGCTWVRCKKKE